MFKDFFRVKFKLTSKTVFANQNKHYDVVENTATGYKWNKIWVLTHRWWHYMSLDNWCRRNHKLGHWQLDSCNTDIFQNKQLLYCQTKRLKITSELYIWEKVTRLPRTRLGKAKASSEIKILVHIISLKADTSCVVLNF